MFQEAGSDLDELIFSSPLTLSKCVSKLYGLIHFPLSSVCLLFREIEIPKVNQEFDSRVRPKIKSSFLMGVA